MNTLFGLGALGTVLIVAVVALVALLVGLGMVRSWIKVARADEALVISGKSQKGEDGSTAATTVVVNGKAIVNPVTQRHEVISLRSRQVNMQADAQSSDNVTLRVDAVALVKMARSRGMSVGPPSASPPRTRLSRTSRRTSSRALCAA